METTTATKLTIAAFAVVAAAPAAFLIGTRFAGGISKRRKAPIAKVQAFVCVANQILN